jgi:signal transduction histidine kinase
MLPLAFPPYQESHVKRRRDSSLHLRYHRFYLISIGLVTLAILILAIISFVHQRALDKSRSQADVLLDGERLAVEWERRVWALSEECLLDPALTALVPDLLDAVKPDDVHELHARLERFAGAHPVAEYLFAFQDGEVKFPRLGALRDLLPPYDLTDTKSPIERQFAAIFREAETEKGQGRYTEAISTYQRCFELSVSDDLKALALQNEAFCYSKAKKPTDAIKAYHQLEERYGDYTDENHRPYAVVAALEIEKLSNKSPYADPRHLELLYDELVNGRWQLSEADAKSCRDLLKEQLGGRTPAPKETKYLRHFKMARVAESALRRESLSMPGRVQARSILQENAGSQLFYVLLPGYERRNRVLALTVDPAYVSGRLLAECRARLQAGVDPLPAFQIDVKASSNASEMAIPFKTVFPFLQLGLPKQAIAASKLNERIEVLLTGGSIVLLLALLGLIFIMLAEVSREITMLHIRTNFLTSASHEHKTPLTLILLYSETLLADEDLMPDERRQCYKVIHREAERLNNLIKNMLLFSQIDRDKRDYALTEGDLGAVVGRTAKVCTEWLGRQGFTVRTDIAPDLPPVRFDVEKVSQALMNVIDNARKYSGTSRSVDIRLRAEGSAVILEVQDAGIGIPEREKDKIFGRYYRSSNAGTQAGSGLGLYLVSDVMQAHNGSISVDSKPGQGSCFRLVFPACAANFDQKAGAAVLLESSERA